MRTHPLNVSYLVVGLVFLGVALSWALHAADVIASADLGWLVPLSLVIAGAIGLVAFVASGRSRRTPSVAASPAAAPRPAYDDTQPNMYDTDDNGTSGLGYPEADTATTGFDAETEGDPR